MGNKTNNSTKSKAKIKAEEEEIEMADDSALSRRHLHNEKALDGKFRRSGTLKKKKQAE